MGTIYLQYPDGQRTQRTEEELRTLWGSELIPRQTIYWKKGMTDWQPVSTWLGERESVANEDHPYNFIVEPTRLTKILQSFLWLNALMGLLAVILDTWSLVQLQFQRTTFEQIMNDPVRSTVGSVQWLVGFFIFIAFLKWTFYAYKNIQGFGAENLHYSPNWAVGYYFIPFVCWVRPVQVMSEIWRASENPRDWSQRKGSSLVAAWWTLFLLYMVSFEISQLVIDPSTLTQFPWTLGFSILSNLLSIPFSTVLYRLVTKIYVHQKNLVDGSCSTTLSP
jgi:hypothetical protein